jgi:hypothetical protein
LHSNEVWVPSFHVFPGFQYVENQCSFFPFNWRMLKSQKLIMFWVVPHLKVGYVMWHIRLCLVSCKLQRCKYNKFGQLARRTLRPHASFLWTIVTIATRVQYIYHNPAAFGVISTNLAIANWGTTGTTCFGVPVCGRGSLGAAGCASALWVTPSASPGRSEAGMPGMPSGDGGVQHHHP